MTFITVLPIPMDELAQKFRMDTTGIIIFSIIMLHLVAGFGYLAFKLSGRKKE